MSTPVPPALAQAVDQREGHRCLKCGRSMTDPPVGGFSRHHRQRRRDGGHTLANLILLCGSGTTGCHGWVHANPDWSRRHGFIVPSNWRPMLDPAVLPVLAHTGWVILGEFGNCPESTAVELLTIFGLRAAA